MTKPAFGYANVLKSTTSSSGGTTSNPASNLYGDRGGSDSAARAYGNAATQTTGFTLKWPTAQNVNCVSFHRTNLPATTSIGFGLLGSSGSVTAGPNAIATVANGQVIFLFGGASLTPVSCFGATWAFGPDANNTDGFVSVGMAWAGTLWLPARPPSFSTTRGWLQQIDSVTTFSGQEYPQMRWRQRTYALDWQSLGGSDEPGLDALAAVGDTGTNVLYIPDVSDTPANINTRSLFGRITSGAIGYPYQGADRRSIKHTITERL